jgi:hypothetical protein
MIVRKLIDSARAVRSLRPNANEDKHARNPSHGARRCFRSVDRSFYPSRRGGAAWLTLGVTHRRRERDARSTGRERLRQQRLRAGQTQRVIRRQKPGTIAANHI